jgi:hypothetical protein
VSQSFFVAFRCPSGTGQVVRCLNGGYYRVLVPDGIVAGLKPAFDWGFPSASSERLAAALLWSLYGDLETVKELYRDLSREVLVHADFRGFVITDEQIHHWTQEQVYTPENCTNVIVETSEVA